MPTKAAVTAGVAAFMITLLPTVSCEAPLSKTVDGHPAGIHGDRASLLHKAPTMDGHYKVVAGPPDTPPVTWIFTPCGDGCAEVQMGGEGSGKRAAARYIHPQWIIDMHSIGALQCGDGTSVSGTAHYSWNPDTLEGRYWSTSDSNHPCGYEQSLDTYPVPLTLTKLGA